VQRGERNSRLIARSRCLGKCHVHVKSVDLRSPHADASPSPSHINQARQSPSLHLQTPPQRVHLVPRRIVLLLSRTLSTVPSFSPYSSNSRLCPTQTSPTRIYTFRRKNMPAKKRCQFHGEQQCNQAALRIIGNCPHCRSFFCGTVRFVC
jgi:hypothetical protein